MIVLWSLHSNWNVIISIISHNNHIWDPHFDETEMETKNKKQKQKQIWEIEITSIDQLYDPDTKRDCIYIYTFIYAQSYK